MTYKDTPANRKKFQQYREHYAPEVKALTTVHLFVLVRDHGGLGTRSEILKDAIYSLACDELKARGHDLPVLSALLSFA